MYEYIYSHDITIRFVSLRNHQYPNIQNMLAMLKYKKYSPTKVYNTGKCSVGVNIKMLISSMVTFLITGSTVKYKIVLVARLYILL